MGLNLILILATLSFVKCLPYEAIDSSLLENVLDAQECHRQIRFIRSAPILAMQFADAGIRTPRGVLTGNTVDLGNYHQCLEIEHHIEDMHIQGKYCSIHVPMDQNFQVLSSEEQQEWSTFNPASLNLDKNAISVIQEYNLKLRDMQMMIGDLSIMHEDYARTIPGNPLSGSVFTLAVCVPKPCSTEQAITSLLFNISEVGFKYSDNYCRVRGDKPWSGADTAAVVVFSVIGFMTLLSTCYDLCYRWVFKRDIKKVNPIYQSWSVYTNGKRIMTFNSGSGNLNCIDGIRAISMMWIILGHSFSTEPYIANPLDIIGWLFSSSALWVSIAPSSVDTFFTLSGMLVVYTTAEKMSGAKLLKNLHWFYLGRIVRITPLLAITSLLQASYFNRMADGPNWLTVEEQTNRCRHNWWSTLLNIQNLLNPRAMCTAHSWYVAIDVQLYFISPLVLFWVLSGKRLKAWLALVIGLLAVLIGSGIYNFNQNFPAGTIVPTRVADQADYMARYYCNTLTRAAPFFIGLIFGYILHIYRRKKIKIIKIFGLLLWACAGAIVAWILYFTNSIKQLDWDNQVLDNIMNTFMRPAWAVAVSLVILTCVHGYGGPVNWFLSLDVWRVPARLSYGMYLLHYPIMFSINSTLVVPIHFNVGLFTFKALSHIALSVVVSFVFTVLVDSPISSLFKQLMLTVQKKRATPVDNNANESKAHNAPRSQETIAPTIMIK